MTGLIECHLDACEGFSRVVAQAEGRWERRSPCPEWDARGVVEHVIGFHDVLLLRPLEAKPRRPKGDPAEGWRVTQAAIGSALNRFADDPRPPVRDEPTGDLGRLLPALSAEVLVHTWDLARAIGVDPALDPRLCRLTLAVVRTNQRQLRDSGMFGAPVPVAEQADATTLLVAFQGRDPSWTA